MIYFPSGCQLEDLINPFLDVYCRSCWQEEWEAPSPTLLCTGNGTLIDIVTVVSSFVVIL